MWMEVALMGKKFVKEYCQRNYFVQFIIWDPLELIQRIGVVDDNRESLPCLLLKYSNECCAE